MNRFYHTDGTNIEVSFIVPGKPQPRQAHHTFIRGGKAVKVMPKESAIFQERVRAYATEAMQGHTPIDRMVIAFYVMIFQAPESLKKAERMKIASGKFDLYIKISKDVDNVQKSIGDGMNGVVFADDKLIVAPFGIKVIGDRPRTIISVFTVSSLYDIMPKMTEWWNRLVLQGELTR